MRTYSKLNQFLRMKLYKAHRIMSQVMLTHSSFYIFYHSNYLILCSFLETNNETKNTNKKLENKIDLLQTEVEALKKIMCKQTILLEQVVKHIRPTSKDLKIFPINSLEELNSAEQLVNNEPESEVVSQSF